MKIILQRVNSAKMFVNDKFMSEIKKRNSCLYWDYS